MNGSLTFGAPHWLWALLLLPAALLLFFRAEREAARRLARLIAARLRAQLAPTVSPTRRRLRFALQLLALAALIVALAQPRVGYEEQPVKRRGLDVIVAVDVSKSMLATDLAPNRLARAKLAVQDLLALLPGDRVGLVAFAGSAFLQAPLTIDYDAVRLAVSELDTELIPRGGTDISAAIELALEAFGKGESGHRAIILLTDGEELEEDAVKTARRAAEAGVPIFTVGLGSPEGSVVPLPSDRQRLGGTDFVRDREGRVVRSRLDEKRLREIASAAGGSYVRLVNGQPEMKSLAETGLARLASGDIDARLSRRPIERYQWPLGFGLLCLALSALIGERRRQKSAVAVPRRANPPAVAATAAALLVLLFSFVGANPLRAAAAANAEQALELYNEGKYDEAYRAYEALLKANPNSGKLQFNAGAAAFQRKDYDGALDAFGRALASNEPDLQPRIQYNLGNTLYHRGEAQKEPDEKIKDWRNAIDYYNSALQATAADPLKATRLRADAEYNRDLVQKQLDEALKKQKQQQQQQKPSDKNQKGGKSSQQQQQQSGDKQKNQPKSGQGKQPNAGKDKSPDGKEDSQGPPQPQPQGQKEGQSGSPDSPPQPDPNGDQQQGEKNASSGSQGDQQQRQQGAGERQDQPPQNSENGGKGDSSNDTAQSGPEPGQDTPRQRGDVRAQRNKEDNNNGDKTAQNKGQKPQGQPQPGDPDAGEGDANAALAADDRMSAAQARALLDALKGEDDRNATAALQARGSRKRRDDPGYNDW